MSAFPVTSFRPLFFDAFCRSFGGSLGAAFAVFSSSDTTVDPGRPCSLTGSLPPLLTPLLLFTFPSSASRLRWNGKFLMEAKQQISGWGFSSAVTCNSVWQTQVGDPCWCPCTFPGGSAVGGFWLVLDGLAPAGMATGLTLIQSERSSNEPRKRLVWFINLLWWDFQAFLCSQFTSILTDSEKLYPFNVCGLFLF